MESLSQELVDAVRLHVDAGRFREALELPDDNRYAAALRANCWDLVPYLLSNIDDDTTLRWPALQACCERLLLVVAERANAEEVLLELIERAETAENDARFVALLKPLRVALSRTSDRAPYRHRSLEWCLNTLRYRLDGLPPPPPPPLERRLLMDSDENARRLIRIYAQLPVFYRHFVERSQPEPVRRTMVCFLIDLLGKPFACLDMECDEKSKSSTRVIAEQIFEDLYRLQEDVFVFIQYVHNKCHSVAKCDRDGVYEDAPADIFLLDEKLTAVSLGVLYYLLLSERLSAPRLPQIYNPVYIYQEALALVVVLLKQDENFIQYKGLKLAYALLDFLPGLAPSSLLSSESSAFVKVLSTVAVYCPAEFVRKKSVCLLKDYIFKFEDKGRCIIINSLYPSLEHSGIKGYVINIYKDVFLDAHRGGRLNYFKGKHLFDFLKMTCTLKDGVETDLVESADLVISCLNLLRFLCLKDTPNDTGVWNYIKDIEGKYLTELRDALDMSKAHYEMKLIDLSGGSGHAPKININVVNPSIDKMIPTKKQRDIVHSGLNALHLIDSLLCRLKECIAARSPVETLECD